MYVASVTMQGGCDSDTKRARTAENSIINVTCSLHNTIEGHMEPPARPRVIAKPCIFLGGV